MFDELFEKSIPPLAASLDLVLLDLSFSPCPWFVSLDPRQLLPRPCLLLNARGHVCPSRSFQLSQSLRLTVILLALANKSPYPLLLRQAPSKYT